VPVSGEVSIEWLEEERMFRGENVDPNLHARESQTNFSKTIPGR